MVVFTRKIVLVTFLCGCFGIGFFLSLGVNAVYAINVEDKTIAYVASYQSGKKVVRDYLALQKQTYGQGVNFNEEVSVKQEFKGDSVNCLKAATVMATLAENTTLNTLGSTIVVDDKEIVTLKDETTARAVLAHFQNQKAIDGESVEVISKTFKGAVELMNKRVNIGEVKSENEAIQLLNKAYLTTDNLDVVMEYTEAISVPEGTTVIASDSLPAGYQAVVSQGQEGKKKNKVRAVVSEEGVVKREVLDTVMVSEPRSTVVVEGTYIEFFDIKEQGGLGVSPIPMTGNITATFDEQGHMWRNRHTGIDIAAPQGTAVKAIGCGVVTFSDWNGAYGNMVAIDHGNGLESRYGHLSKIEVPVGAKIETGDIIGLCGQTGNTTGSHLHFEIKVNGELFDPDLYF